MDDYQDIIHLPHHVSQTYPRMSRRDRAAQFAPFAALVGLDAAMEETARFSEESMDLGKYLSYDEDGVSFLSEP